MTQPPDGSLEENYKDLLTFVKRIESMPKTSGGYGGDYHEPTRADLNDLIREARRLVQSIESVPIPPQPKLAQWVVHVSGTLRLTTSIEVAATSEQAAQEVALNRARSYGIDDFNYDGTEDLQVETLERLP